MEMISVYYEIICFLIGTIAGFLSGLLGIGGGIVVVPALFSLFAKQHFPANSLMHLAAGTSFAVMLFTTLRSLYSHSRRRIEFATVYWQLLPGVLIGVLVGTLLAHGFHSAVLQWIFIVLILFVSIQLLFPGILPSKDKMPTKRVLFLGGGVIGLFSGMLGIGGSVFTIPFLLYFGRELRSAIVVSIAVGVSIAITGLICTILFGSLAHGLPPDTIGYVYWPAAIGIAVGSVLLAPVGVYFSHKVPVTALRRLFAFFLVVVAIHMMLHN